MTDPERRLAPVVRVAPAKLNLTLAVVGRRDDGFHALHSVVVPLGLADRLSLAVRAGAGDSTGTGGASSAGKSAGAGDSLHVTGFDPGPEADNLVLRAIAATRAVVARTWPGAPAQPPALAARLDKRIPVTAGLGGGSSDAAAAIDAALEAWGATATDEERVRIAVSIGSDVPLFLAGGPALIEGRGERVTRLHGVRCAPGAEPGVLLVTPALALHTADVFAAWSAGAMAEPGIARRASEHFASEFGSGLTGRQLLERAAVLASANDLAAAANVVAPELIPFRRALTRLIGRPVGLSGSGPTMWVLYPSLAAAEEAAVTVRSAVERGELDAPGAGPPFVAATPMAAGQIDDPTPGDDSSRRAQA